MLIAAHKNPGWEVGPSIAHWEGIISKSSKLDAVIHSYAIILCSEVNKFLAKVKPVEDVTDIFSVFRSLRRASDDREIDMKVSPNDIYAVNRWKKLEKDNVKVVTGAVRQHYA